MSEQRPLNPIAATWLPTDPPRQAPPLLTDAEACCLLRLPASGRWQSLATLRKRGLSAVQIGRHVRYPLAEVLDFIDRQMQENPR